MHTDGCIKDNLGFSILSKATPVLGFEDQLRIVHGIKKPYVRVGIYPDV